jgi:hypothetical protein
MECQLIFKKFDLEQLSDGFVLLSRPRCPLILKKQAISPHFGTARLVHAHHDAGRFDDGVSRFTLFEFKFVRRLNRDRGGDNLSADIDSNMGSGSALLHFNDLTFELIARADLHQPSSNLHHSSRFIAPARIMRSNH